MNYTLPLIMKFIEEVDRDRVSSICLTPQMCTMAEAGLG